MDRKYGQEDPATITAATSVALDGNMKGLLPFYLVAVAAGVTVWFLTRYFYKKKGK